MERSHDIMQVELHTQENEKNKDHRLLLDLPQDILRDIIRYAGANYARLTFVILYQLRRVCKKLEQDLKSYDELKIILNLSQHNLDNSLRFHLTPETNLDFAFLKSLIAMGADLTRHNQSDGKTCLHYMSFNSDNNKFDQHLAKLYLEHGAQVNQVDYEGNTPLHWAVQFYKVKIVKELLEHNAQMDLKNKKGDMPINILLQRVDRPKIAEILKVLIEHGLNTTVQYKVWDNTMTIAEWAKGLGDLKIYKLVTDDLPWYEQPNLLWKVESENCVIS